ncbi:MAG TPA: alpha/beta hydrolase [Pyrinomonadaceae bacterium]
MTRWTIRYSLLLLRSIFIALVFLVPINSGATQSVEKTNQPTDQLKIVRVNGVELHYLDRGKGTPVIFVHGGLDDYRYWQSQMEPFSEAYRVIAYSRRYNFPNQNPLRQSDHSVIVEAADLVELIRSLKLGRVHIVGASYGAYTALFLAFKHPEMVRSLVLAEAPVFRLARETPEGLALYEEFLAKLWHPAATAFRRRDKQHALRLSVEYFAGEGAFDKAPESLRRGWRDNLLEWQALTTSRDAFPVLNVRDLKNIQTPTLMLSGERTLNILKFVDGELRPLLGAQRVIIPHASHDMWTEQPDVCRQATLEFLVKH